MSEIMLMRTPQGTMAPCDPQAAEYIAKLKIGASIKAKCVKARNPKFHRKAFALLNLAFECWEPADQEYKGEKVAKSFDRFRKDITVLSGYYEAVTNLRGEVRLEAKSLSFSNMDEAEFGEVYQAILNVVWNKVLRDCARYKSPEEVDSIVNELLRFDQ